MATNSSRGFDIFPPVLFVHFNHELIRLIDSSEGLTAANYASLSSGAMRSEM
jgi:hypothetical protein